MAEVREVLKKTKKEIVFKIEVEESPKKKKNIFFFIVERQNSFYKGWKLKHLFK